MLNTAWGLRVRSLLADYFVPMMVVVLLVAALGGYVTATTYTGTETQVRTSQTTTWEDSGSFTHSATVVNGTAVYDEGEVLRDRSVYFQAVTPRLDGTFLYGYTAREGGNLTASVTLTLVLRSAAETEAGNTTEYWRLDSRLVTDRTQLSPGDRLQVPFTLNVSNASQRLDTVDGQFGGTPGTKELFVSANVSLSGTRNGVPVESTRTYRLPVTVDGNVYEVGAAGPVVDANTRTVREATPVSPGPLRAYGGPVLLVAGLLAGLCCVGARQWGVTDPSEREREWLAHRDARQEFDDWITRTDGSSLSVPETAITVATLEGLVDVAIDTDSRVLSDPAGEVFAVFTTSQVYRYDAPSDPTGESADPLADREPAPEDGAEGDRADGAQ
jgi:hypothetical protein